MTTNSITSSGRKSASTQIATLSGKVHGLLVRTDGTNNATVNVYDSSNSTLSGKLEVLTCVVVGADRFRQIILPEQGVSVNDGIYVDLSGTGAEFTVLYSLG